FVMTSMLARANFDAARVLSVIVCVIRRPLSVLPDAALTLFATEVLPQRLTSPTSRGRAARARARASGEWPTALAAVDVASTDGICAFSITFAAARSVKPA